MLVWKYSKVLSYARIISLLLYFSISFSNGSSLIPLASAGHDIGHYIPKVKTAIESILRSCHRTYSQALLTSSKTTIGIFLANICPS